MEAEENIKLIIEHFKSYSEYPETVNIKQMWGKTVRKLWQKNAAQSQEIPKVSNNNRT